MIVAVTSSGSTLDADVDPRFGRCAYFLIVETETMELEAVENTHASLVQGAGIQSTQLLAERQVRHILTGSCGPNAYDALSAAGIDVTLSCSGTVREILARFKSGQLDTADGPDVNGHAGVTGPPSSSEDQTTSPKRAVTPGGGMGCGPCGRGMGRGKGRGMGRGRVRGQRRGGGAGGAGRGRGIGDQAG